LRSRNDIEMDHAMLNCWVLKYVALLGRALRVHKRPAGPSWRMDETDVRVKGGWKYLYRSIRPAPQRPVAGDRRNVPGTAILFIGG
jgi:putative transposase